MEVLTMEKLTHFETAFLRVLLKKEKRNLEEYLEKNGNSFEAYFVRSESLPMIEDLLKKFED
jgi:hypothetical protein